MSPQLPLSLAPAPPGRSGQDKRTLRPAVVPQSLRGYAETRQHDTAGLFVAGFAICVLVAGWIGIVLPGENPALLLGQDRESGVEAVLEVMPSLAEQNSGPAAAEEAAELPEEPPLTPDIPEPVPALTEADAFPVPEAPDLVTALSLPQAKSERSRPTARSSPPASAPPSGKPAAAAPSRTAPGGSGSGEGSGSGKTARTPQPPYPSFARSRRMTGSVLVSILVDSSGTVISATVTRSCGFPELDNYTADFIRRRWRWPEGGRRTFLQPVSYRLR